MKATDSGRLAEDVVARFLRDKDYKVLNRNWRTKSCEIDIVAYKARRVHFVEVKYRSNLDQGDGFTYITPKKLKRMKYAAEIWVNKFEWSGEYVLAAASVYGQSRSIQFIELT